MTSMTKSNHFFLSSFFWEVVVYCVHALSSNVLDSWKRHVREWYIMFAVFGSEHFSLSCQAKRGAVGHIWWRAISTVLDQATHSISMSHEILHLLKEDEEDDGEASRYIWREMTTIRCSSYDSSIGWFWDDLSLDETFSLQSAWTDALRNMWRQLQRLTPLSRMTLTRDCPSNIASFCEKVDLTWRYLSLPDLENLSICSVKQVLSRSLKLEECADNSSISYGPCVQHHYQLKKRTATELYYINITIVS